MKAIYIELSGYMRGAGKGYEGEKVREEHQPTQLMQFYIGSVAKKELTTLSIPSRIQIGSTLYCSYFHYTSFIRHGASYKRVMIP